MTRTRIALCLYWGAPSLVCLLLFWQGFTAWFRTDDFAWMGLASGVHNWRDLVPALFAPQAQGTIRVLSERVLFLAGFNVFGMDPLPYRILIFATQFANLVLVAAIGNRIAGVRAAGFWAAVLWLINGAMVDPLGWVSAFNQVLGALFLLLGMYGLLRSIEAAKAGNMVAAKRWEIFGWLVFLVGLGAHELNILLPVLLAAYCWCCAPWRLLRTVPQLAISGLYFVLRMLLVPPPRAGDYAPHFGPSMLSVLGKYWTWTVGPLFLRTPWQLPEWVVGTAIAVVSLGLLVFTVSKIRSGGRAAAFCVAWYLIALAPVLPLRDHLAGYYLYIPLIGICWLGGWALTRCWEHGAALKALAATAALVYAAMVLPPALARSRANYFVTMKVRDLVEGVASAHQQHPGQTILLEGVNSELFWNAVLDRPFRALGIPEVWLTPGSDGHIDAHANLGDIHEFLLPADAVARGLARGQIVVYDVTGERLRNITEGYTARPAPAVAERIDVANPLTADRLGPEWYRLEQDHRWMPRRASIRMAAPASGGRKLSLEGACSPEQLRAGPLHVTARADGIVLGVEAITSPDGSFQLEFPLPASLLGKPEIRVEIEVDRTIRPPNDDRDLGLAFGSIAIR